MRTRKIKKILFITLSNLGDIILTTPVLEKLCDEFSEADIDVITGLSGQEVFDAHPKVNEVMVRNRRMGLFGRMREVVNLTKRRYDLVVDLKGSLLPYMIGAKYRSKLFVSTCGVRHKKDEHLTRISHLSKDVLTSTRFFVLAGVPENSYIKKIIADGKDKKMVIINPGARSHLKRWGAEKYAKLSDRLISELKTDVYITGDKDDRETIDLMLGACIRKDLTNLCGKTNVIMLIQLMKQASLVITNDSAPLHIASSVNVPTVAIFGPSNEKKYGPLSEKKIVISPKVPCRPCEKALCGEGPDEGCLSRVKVDEVFRAAKKLLSL